MAQALLNILLADNNEADRLQIRNAMKEGGLAHECTETTNIRDAIHLCEKRVFDCAIIDHQLTDQDGTASIAALLERLPYLAIIIASIESDAMVATDVLKRGALDYILKANITPEAIRRISENAVERAVHLLKAAQQRQELENFATMLVHDLRTPIRSMNGLTRIIEKDIQQETIDIPKVIHYCQIVNGAAQRMDSLIETLHKYTKADEQVVFEPVEMRKVVEDMLSNISCEIEEKDVRVTYDELPTVIGNAPQLIQLMQNLVCNSIKYCEEGIPTIHITARVYEENSWLFTVQDNGIGISEEFYRRVFEPFQRLHGAGKYDGIGLGLALCRKIIDRHGGSIWCESKKGHGTLFSFTLCGVDIDEDA